MNERDPSSSDCKHKSTCCKNGAPPGKVGVLYCVLHINGKCCHLLSLCKPFSFSFKQWTVNKLMGDALEW